MIAFYGGFGVSSEWGRAPIEIAGATQENGAVAVVDSLFVFRDGKVNVTENPGRSPFTIADGIMGVASSSTGFCSVIPANTCPVVLNFVEAVLTDPRWLAKGRSAGYSMRIPSYSQLGVPAAEPGSFELGGRDTSVETGASATVGRADYTVPFQDALSRNLSAELTGRFTVTISDVQVNGQSTGLCSDPQAPCIAYPDSGGPEVCIPKALLPSVSSNTFLAWYEARKETQILPDLHPPVMPCTAYNDLMLNVTVVIGGVHLTVAARDMVYVVPSHPEYCRLP